MRSQNEVFGAGKADLSREERWPNGGPEGKRGLTRAQNVFMMNKLGLALPQPAVKSNQAARGAFALLLLPPRSTAGQLTLDQHIGVRIPGGQPIPTVSRSSANLFELSPKIIKTLIIRFLSRFFVAR